MAEKYKKLLDKRNNAILALQSHLTKIKDRAATSQTAIPQVEAQTREKQIELSYDKYCKIMDQIDDSDEVDYEKLSPSNVDVEELYVTLCNILKPLAKETELLSSTLASHSQPKQDLKMPHVEIPTFDGKPENWTAFYDSFTVWIDQSESLPDVAKMQILKSKLVEKGWNTISYLPISESNYKLAWQVMCDRYHNVRALVNSALNMFLSQPKIAQPTAESLRALIDTTKNSFQWIETLNVDVESWDPIIVHIVQSKLDPQTLKSWETNLKGSKQPPKLEEMFEFLETEFRINEASEETPQSSERKNMTTKSKSSEKTEKRNNACVICQSTEHWIFFCSIFNNWSVRERTKYVKDKKLCRICLHDHDISQCHSKYRCNICKGDHNSKLHESTTSHINAIKMPNHTDQNIGKLFATAIVKVKDKYGNNHNLRVFIDQGSEGVVITAVQLLHLSKKREVISLEGLDGSSLGTATGTVQLQVESCLKESFKISVEALVKRSILSTNTYTNKKSDWKYLNGLFLADPEFLSTRRIDLLFGVDIYATIIENGIRKGRLNEPVAQKSALGWLVFGAISTKNSPSIKINTLTLSQSLQRFWENEKLNEQPILSEEFQQCVDLCKKSMKSLPDGRIQVSIPFNMDQKAENFLGDSRRMAMKRFFLLEKKLNKTPGLREKYNEDILSYMKNGHMSISNSPHDEGYYLPHREVIRLDSTTTKLRTVFDGSAKSSNGFSLNDRCLNGPTIQPELVDTFNRWRLHKFALKTDVEKMYQIHVAPEDRKYLKVLYRFSDNEPIKTYELNTVTFGIKPSPYMAIESTFFLADREKHNYPEAAKRVKTDFYVDDGLSGSHSIESTKQLRKELTGLFNSAHLPLRKWASNDESALEGVPSEHRAIDSSIELDLDESIKTVGMGWTPKTDKIKFSIKMSSLSQQDHITKRQLLSDSSKLYDPCGILSPITVKAKILMQQIWKSGTNWDDLVNESIQTEWNIQRAELPFIEDIRIDRWFNTLPSSKISLHGFCDSSEKAMAACIYIVSTTNDITTSSLVCSKTKVAPIDPVSIPRLELCGAVLLAKLTNRVANNFGIHKENVYLWTDSEIVIHWLQSYASHWKTFVAHRVNDIQQLYDASQWYHVRTHENPADIASRGALPTELKNNSLWFHGPSWLQFSDEHWPKIRPTKPVDCKLEEKANIKVNASTVLIKDCEFIDQFDNLPKLLRITSLCLRFINHCAHKETLKYTKHFVTYPELVRAKHFLVKHVQLKYFPEEISALKIGKSVSEKSNLKTLYPQFNAHGIMILHGRLEHSNLPNSQKYPMILPAKNHLSKLFIDNAHKTTLHGTIHLTLARLRQEVWVLNGRNEVKSYIHNCKRCFRQNPKPINQLMAPLPAYKTTPSRAFLHCGLDFAGPIMIKSADKRNAVAVKAYICVFVCMASKAMHLELVGNYTTDRFILALRRMMARRGLSTDIYCDQGSNFEGASNELPRLFLQAESTVSIEMAKAFANDGIHFHFMPPSAPSWGGQWESFVKLTKHHLYRMTTQFKYTFEEMSTLLTQIEACVNSRPLCALTNDIDDLDPLTAGHLLIGGPMNLIPEPSLLSLRENTLNRFQSIQRQVQTFWRRFSTEYLHSLHPRKKWYKPQQDLAIGDLVSIIDDNLPPGKWLLGRVINILPSSDGFIRLVTIKTTTTTLNRPITKLCKFPAAPENVSNPI